MRLTLALRGRQHKGRWIKNMWRDKGVFVDKPVLVPQALVDRGVKVVDPTVPPPLPEWRPSVPDDIRFAKPRPIEEDPRYKELAAYRFNHTTRFIEGIKQACILTKALEFSGLPPGVQRLVGKVTPPHQDLLLQRYIMQAQRWDPTMDRLPKRIDISNITWHFAREYGISKQRSTTLLLNNLVRLCRSVSGQFPSLMTDRRYISRPTISTHYFFKDKLVNIRGTNEMLVSGNRGLPPFADSEQVTQSTGVSLPDMFPIAPTIDLAKEHVYDIVSSIGWQREHNHSQPQMLFIPNHDHWTTPYQQSRALLFCLGYAVTEARTKYGSDTKHLSEPVCVQCVNMDESKLNFVFLQLNTLDFTNDDGVKNFVWFDSDNHLFAKHKSQPWKGEEYNSMRLDRFNPEAFTKLMALFMYGAPEVEKWI